MAVDSYFDVLIITPSIDHALLEFLSKDMKIVICEFKEIGNEFYFKIVSLSSGKGQKYYFPRLMNHYSIAKILGEKIRNNFGVPRLVDMDLRAKPIWIGSYFPALFGSELLLRFYEGAVADRRLAWLTGLAGLMLTHSKEEAQKLTVSNINPIQAIPPFRNFSDKELFFRGIYSKYLINKTLPKTNNQIVEELVYAASQSQATKRVLIISYCSPHGTALGAVRPTYWHRKLGDISKNKIETFFLTALKTNESFSNFYALKDETVFNFANHEDWYNFEQTLSGPVSNQAATWTITVYKHLSKQILSEFDAIVITGNPFYLFNLPVFWGNWPDKPKIYLDYRDPFAKNTRYKYTEIQKREVCMIEEQWNGKADKIIAVNSICSNLVVGKSQREVMIIQNGYDEEKINYNKNTSLLDKNKLNFVYTGSVFRDRNIVPLIHALNPNYHALHIAGRIADFQAEINDAQHAHDYGLLSYEAAMQLVHDADFAVLLLSGCPFVSTTKIYDYISLNKFILALSDKPEDEQTFLTDFHSYPSKVLLKNDTGAIVKFLETFEPKSKANVDTKRYSRRAATEELAIEILRS